MHCFHNLEIDRYNLFTTKKCRQILWVQNCYLNKESWSVIWKLANDTAEKWQSCHHGYHRMSTNHLDFVLNTKLQKNVFYYFTTWNIATSSNIWDSIIILGTIKKKLCHTKFIFVSAMRFFTRDGPLLPQIIHNPEIND